MWHTLSQACFKEIIESEIFLRSSRKRVIIHKVYSEFNDFETGGIKHSVFLGKKFQKYHVLDQTWFENDLSIELLIT